MLYAICLYDVQTCNIPAFIKVFDYEGTWRRIFSRFEGYIHVDLLQNPSFPSMFLSIEFWTSEQAYGSAQDSQRVADFTRSLRPLITAQLALGTFLIQRSVEKYGGREGSASHGITDQCQQGRHL